VPVGELTTVAVQRDIAVGGGNRFGDGHRNLAKKPRYRLVAGMAVWCKYVKIERFLRN
jgi:hypothetical protein